MSEKPIFKPQGPTEGAAFSREGSGAPKDAPLRTLDELAEQVPEVTGLVRALQAHRAAVESFSDPAVRGPRGMLIR